MGGWLHGWPMAPGVFCGCERIPVFESKALLR